MAAKPPFTVTSFGPSMALQPYIQCFRIVESAEACVNKVLPNLLPVLALRLRGQTGYLENGISSLMPAGMLSGLRKTPRIIYYEGNSANLLVVFREGGMRAFFKEPAHELFNQSIALDCFTGMNNAISRLEEALAEAGNNAACIAVVEAFLLDKLLPCKPDVLVAAAIQQIREHSGELSIKALAATLFIS